ncbi:3'(2'),5'-bisphosphate nucleotidase CysQ [Gammaproteobacteria bacterium AS21]
MIDGIEQINALAKSAGKKILDVYNSDFDVDFKDDDSPLTQADTLAHQIICAGLALIAPHIPILSEESSAQSIANRLCWSRYWLVDPLDGTKEFVSRNGEFTVNIALIDNGKAIFGVVYAPVLDQLYWGSEQGAFTQGSDGLIEQIYVARTPALQDTWRVVASRTHQNEETKNYLQRFGGVELATMGSSLKFCLIAQGLADVYPRLAPTCEWDSGAAQAVVEAAGGCVLEYPSLQPLRYNSRNTLLNPHFIVCAESPLLWA